MTSEQPPPNDTPEQPDTGGAVPVDGPRSPDDRERTAAVDEPAYREVTVRRAPKFVPFMVLGALLGFLVALIVTYTGPVDPTLTRESVLGFFTVAFAIPGLILAALLVLLFDRRSYKRAGRARAERVDDDEA